MGNKRIGVGTACGVFENWGVDFDKTVRIHEVTNGLPEFGATNQAVANLGVDIHVDVATAITLFFIGETVAAGEGAEGFSEEADVI